jgi:hypothetical protein
MASSRDKLTACAETSPVATLPAKGFEVCAASPAGANTHSSSAHMLGQIVPFHENLESIRPFRLKTINFRQKWLHLIDAHKGLLGSSV